MFTHRSPHPGCQRSTNGLEYPDSRYEQMPLQRDTEGHLCRAKVSLNRKTICRLLNPQGLLVLVLVLVRANTPSSER